MSRRKVAAATAAASSSYPVSLFLPQMPTVASLTDDLLVEILSRLPVKSFRRCMCVSRTWRSIISHPRNRRQLPQTLEGFFYGPGSEPGAAPTFTNVTGTGHPLVSPFFDFLPEHQSIFPSAVCNGLLLCRCWKGQDDFHYVVCNPATRQWVRLPDSVNAGTKYMARLCFDPAVSDHFHVFEFTEDHDSRVTGIEMYSSKTGGWVHKENGWIDTEAVDPSIAVVDTEGKTWRNIPISNLGGLIQKSQGLLHFANFLETDDGMVQLVVYVLENYRGEEWILKHSTDASYIFGEREIDLDGFKWVAMHPDCNMIFLTMGCDDTLISYDMDHHQVKEICDLEEVPYARYLPFVPLYSELQTLHM